MTAFCDILDRSSWIKLRTLGKKPLRKVKNNLSILKQNQVVDSVSNHLITFCRFATGLSVEITSKVANKQGKHKQQTKRPTTKQPPKNTKQHPSKKKNNNNYTQSPPKRLQAPPTLLQAAWISLGPHDALGDLPAHQKHRRRPRHESSSGGWLRWSLKGSGFLVFFFCFFNSPSPLKTPPQKKKVGKRNIF